MQHEQRGCFFTCDLVNCFLPLPDLRSWPSVTINLDIKNWSVLHHHLSRQVLLNITQFLSTIILPHLLPSFILAKCRSDYVLTHSLKPNRTVVGCSWDWTTDGSLASKTSNKSLISWLINDCQPPCAENMPPAGIAELAQSSPCTARKSSWTATRNRSVRCLYRRKTMGRIRSRNSEMTKLSLPNLNSPFLLLSFSLIKSIHCNISLVAQGSNHMYEINSCWIFWRSWIANVTTEQKHNSLHSQRKSLRHTRQFLWRGLRGKHTHTHTHEVEWTWKAEIR